MLVKENLIEEVENKESTLELDTEKTITFSDLFGHIKRNIIWVISIALTITIGFVVYALFLTDPTYKSEASLIINPEKFSVENVDGIDYTGSLRATETIEKWMVENLVLKETIKSLGLEGQLSVGSLKSCIQTENSTYDIIIYISVTTDNPEKSRDYLDALIATSLELSNNYEQLEKSYALLSAPELGVKSSINKVMTILIGIAVGALVGLAFGLIKGIYSSQFTSSKDVERVLGLRSLGAIIDDEIYRNEYLDAFPISEINHNNYENLLNNINFSNVDNKIKVLAFSSALQDEGKSSTIYNLANIVSVNKKKALVIDLDLRRSKEHHYFGVKRGKGVTDFITGQETSENVLTHVADNLDLISAGGKTPNPTLVLQSEKLSELINQLRDNYDYILIDTPPVFMADTKIISKNVDAFIFVVSAFSTKTYIAKDAVNDLKTTGTNIIGSVITKLKKNRHYYDRYYYYYNDSEEKK